MEIDNLQKTWQSQEPVRQITIDPEVLLREVRWSHQHFRAEIFWRDVREAGLSLLSAPLLILWAEYYAQEFIWTVYLMAIAMVAVGVFIVLDRIRQKRMRPAPNDTLLDWAESSLADVEHQIWLLRNIFWWYLLPPAAAIAVIYGYATWECRDFWLDPMNSWPGLLILLGLWTFSAAFLYWVYRLNQRWVQKKGQPRRTELKELVERLRSPEIDQQKPPAAC
jgi:hypothetical protein